MSRLITTLGVASALLLSPAALAQSAVQFPEALDAGGYNRVRADAGAVIIAGQPDEAAFEALPAQGVTTVINLRTPQEMSSRVPFDEEAKAAELGLNYSTIPLGGDDYPYTPDAVDALAAILADADGDVLLHCASARRASYLWAAYLVSYQGMDVEQATSHAEAINFGPPQPMLQMIAATPADATDDAGAVADD
ncbi:MAG: sulfur transferase domain-containing protein [Maricaulaceae bacterium]|jgi:uncharacterized protein (TIGR01244 family)